MAGVTRMSCCLILLLYCASMPGCASKNKGKDIPSPLPIIGQHQGSVKFKKKNVIFLFLGKKKNGTILKSCSVFRIQVNTELFGR